MKLRYTDRSKVDVELAFAWYERQRRGLGFEFLDCDIRREKFRKIFQKSSEKWGKK